jgi:multidrug resistance protein, MATE family
VDGFAYAAEALVGKYKGAGDSVMIRRIVKRLFEWGAVLSVLYTLLYLMADTFILRLLTNDNHIITAALPYLWWVVLIPLISFSAFLWDGIYIGATASSSMRNSMLVSTLFVFLPLYFLLQPLFGNHALWIALLSFMGARSVLLSLMAGKAVLVTGRGD